MKGVVAVTGTGSLAVQAQVQAAVQADEAVLKVGMERLKNWKEIEEALMETGKERLKIWMSGE